MKKTIIVSILALLLFHGLFPSLSIGDEQTKERDNVALEIMTVEIMVDQLEKMPRVTEEEQNAWAGLSRDIRGRFKKIVTYETRDNLNLWKLVGRWATAKVKSLKDRSPYADAPFYHIQRIQPDYQKDEELFRLMAKLNAIRMRNGQGLEIDGYRNFVYLFEKCDTGDAEIQLLIGRAYNKGYGLWRNYTEALKWYKRAAEAGNADALGELGHAHLLSTLYGIEEDVETGVKLLNEAVANGSASAAFTLGQHYSPGDRKKAIEMFRIAAAKGYHNAFAKLAGEYVEVGNGTEALRWANGGHEPDPNNKIEHRRWELNRSMVDIGGSCSYIKGKVYALGIGQIEQDLIRAKKLFEESYRDGYQIAAEELSAMYREGIGVEANATLAEQWKNNALKWHPNDSSYKQYVDRKIRAFAEKLREASTRTR